MGGDAPISPVRALAKSLEDLGLATVIDDGQGINDINSRVCQAVELLQKEKVIKHAFDYKWIMECSGFAV